MIDAENALKWEELNLDYEGENKYASFFSSTGNLHTYPAKAVPEMVSDLIKKVMSIKSIKTVLDPFVGSGTTALESKYLGLDFWGSDLNPLAVLLSKTKVLTIDNTNYTKKRLSDFVQQVKKEYPDARLIPFYTFNSINYWFKEENIRELSFLKYKMDQFINNANKVNREMYALILLTAFSSTIRRVSLTRNGEFKLYRMSPSDIERFSINAIDEFEDAVTHLLDMLVVANNSYKKETISTICLQNAKSLNYLKNKSIDLVVTSPPYGDSKTTVAYGEFSKLSLQWMEDLLKKYIRIEVADCNCDEQLLGGRKSEWSLQDEKDFYKSNEVVNLETQIQSRIQEKKRDLARAKKVLEEMRGCINNKRFVSIDLLHKNEILYQLISERVRLDIYRKIKNSKAGLKDKETKKLAKKNAGEYMKQMENIYSSKYVIRQTHFTGSGGWCCAEKARLTTVVGTEYYLVVYCTNPTEGVSLRTGSIATAVGNPVMCAASTKIIPGTSVTATGSGYSSTRTFSVSGDDIPNTAQVRTISLSGTGMSKIKRWRLMAPNKSVWVANESDFYPSINFNFVNDSSSNAKLKGTWSVAFQSSSSSYTFIPSYSVSYYYEYGD